MGKLNHVWPNPCSRFSLKSIEIQQSHEVDGPEFALPDLQRSNGQHRETVTASLKPWNFHFQQATTVLASIYIYNIYYLAYYLYIYHHIPKGAFPVPRCHGTTALAANRATFLHSGSSWQWGGKAY
jgi:hypothetical protein